MLVRVGRKVESTIMIMMLMLMMMPVMPVKKYIHEAWPAKLSVSEQPSMVTPALFNCVNFAIGAFE